MIKTIFSKVIFLLFVVVSIFANSALYAMDIPQSVWSLQFVDSEELQAPGQSGAATNAFDGDVNTIWHTEWFNSSPAHPHEIQIDLGDVYEIDAFRYLPRQSQSNGRIRNYEFYVSADGVNWGSPVASGAFNKNNSEKRVTFATTVGQFVRLVALSEVKGNVWTTVAELNVEGVLSSGGGNQAPNGVINSPVSNVTIDVGDTVDFMGTGMDSDGPFPLAYLWDFGGGAANSTAQDPGPVQFNSAGNYTVTFTVTDDDGNGLPDPSPDQRLISVTDNSDPTIPQSSWNVKFVNSEELVGQNAPATNAFDGNINTIWHTEWFNSSPSHPHELQIDLGMAYEIDAFRYFPRQSQSNGRIRNYEFYVSADGVNWGPPVATGTWAKNSSEKRVTFATKTGQFIRLVALDSFNGKPWTAVAELNLEGRCDTPFVKITQPLTNGVQAQPNLNVTASACLNSTIHSGWGVRFKLNGGAPSNPEFDDNTSPYTAVFSGVAPTDHMIEAVIIDNNGMEQSASDTVTQIGSGDHYVAFGDSITLAVCCSDDFPADDNSGDGRNTGGGYEPILNDLLTMSNGYPHTVINEGVNGLSTFAGLALLPAVLNRNPDARFYLITLGTNDTSSGMIPLLSGTNLMPGDPGYPGTYKDYMQQIIALVRNSGLNPEPYLGKLPYALTTATRLAKTRELNDVVDQLISENSIMVTPPDFYTFYELNQNQLFDNFHPNGVGYQSMATCWSQAIQNLPSSCDPPP